MPLEYIGVCATSQSGAKHIWVYAEILEVTHAHVGISNNLQKASGVLDKWLCEKIYPGLWRLIEEKMLAGMEVDDGAE